MPSAWPDGLLNPSSVNLDTLTGVSVLDWSGLLAPGTREGGYLVIPEADGDSAVAADGRTFAAYDFTIPLDIAAVDSGGAYAATTQGIRAQLLANLAGVQAWLGNGGDSATYTRRHSSSAVASVDRTAVLSYVGGLQAAVRPGSLVCTVDLVLHNHSGGWLNGATLVWP